MNVKTYTRRSNELLQQIQNHPHRDELLNIMLQQLVDEEKTIASITTSN